MRPAALIMMMFAWLVYGGMPAWAGCPLCVQTGLSLHAENLQAGMTAANPHHAHSAKPDATKLTPKQADPCMAGGTGHMTLCAACLALPPIIAEVDPLRGSSYPMPSPAAALADLRPAPLSPPPRSL